MRKFPVVLLGIVSFLLMLTPSVRGGGVPVEGLLVHYPFDGDLKDHSGQYVTGNAMGDAIFVKGVISQSLYLDGYGDYIDLGNGLNLGRYFTVSFWVKSDDLSRKWAAVLAKYETDRYGPYDFCLNYDKAAIWVSDGNGSYDEIQGRTSLAEKKWYFVAYTLDIHDLRIYINGRLDNIGAIRNVNKNNDRVTIGRQALMFEPYQDLEFEGCIDDLRAYNRPLSPEEITDIYNWRG